MPKSKELNEYQAALLTGLSPTLLRWLTKYAPKSGSDRKLLFTRKDGDTLFFDRDELIAFNDWLKSPWPRKGGERTPIPTGIRAEIKTEANGTCAICHGHVESCEAAHLDPVSKSNNNHPENLLWLCSNHHTVYDKDLFGPTGENAEFVVEFKRVLHRFKRMLWTMQDKISAKLFAVLDTCAMLLEQLRNAKTPAQVDAVERLGKAALKHLPNLAPVSKSDPKFAAFEKINVGMAFIADAKNEALPARLGRAMSVREEVAVAFGFVSCPLCHGTGRHAGSDCPVCSGDGQIAKDAARRFDAAEFEEVDCPVCKGSGTRRGSDCPACNGDAQIEQRFQTRLIQVISMMLIALSAKATGRSGASPVQRAAVTRKWNAAMRIGSIRATSALLIALFAKATGRCEGSPVRPAAAMPRWNSATLTRSIRANTSSSIAQSARVTAVSTEGIARLLAAMRRWNSATLTRSIRANTSLSIARSARENAACNCSPWLGYGRVG